MDSSMGKDDLDSEGNKIPYVIPLPTMSNKPASLNFENSPLNPTAVEFYPQTRLVNI